MPNYGYLTGQTKVCLFCGEDFYVPPYRAAIAKYCSRSCLAKVHLPQFAGFRFQKTGRPPHKYKTITTGGRTVRIHRHIVEQHLGRRLKSWEHVHHINGDPSDNRVENLIVLSNADHQRVELSERRQQS